MALAARLKQPLFATFALLAALLNAAYVTHPGRGQHGERSYEHEWQDARYQHDRYYEARVFRPSASSECGDYFL
jgi:hypothetical protein